MSAENLGDKGERLLGIALNLATTVRDEPKDRIGHHLAGIDQADKDGLLIVLAALVDVERSSPQQLLSWVTWDETGRPLPKLAGNSMVDSPELCAQRRARLLEPDWNPIRQVAQGPEARQGQVRAAQARQSA